MEDFSQKFFLTRTRFHRVLHRGLDSQEKPFLFDRLTPTMKDAACAIFFGILSAALSKIQFNILDIGGSNLREIPLLISLFYFRNPVFIIGLSLFTLIGSPLEIPDWAAYSVHLIPLFNAWVFFKLIERKRLSSTLTVIAWMLVTVAYYLIFLLPLAVMSLQLVVAENDFLKSYLYILPSVRFEIVISTLVTGLYLMQLEVRKTLEHNNKNLETIVENRTIELISANNELLDLNKELTASNEEIKILNDKLEKTVKERTAKINDQLSQLMRYAYMNSHEVRAPLARMLGLLNLIKREHDTERLKELLDKLLHSSNDLDKVVRKMNRLLEEEITAL